MEKQANLARRTQQERREHTRNLLLEATIKQIAINGLHGCKLADIVRSANVTTGAVQHLFGNRDALIMRSIEDIFRRTQMYNLPESGTIEERLTALIDYIIYMSGKHLYRALIDIIINSRHDSKLGASIRKLLRRQNKRRAVWFAAYMADLNIPESRLLVLERSIASSLYGLEMLSMGSWSNDEYEIVLKKSMQAHINLLLSE